MAEQDYPTHLVEQIDFLEASIERYDAGKEHEAKRAATQIRLLVHNTRRSVSLLEHLGVQDCLGWVDMGAPQPPPNTIVISFGLCVVRMRFDTGVSEYRPAILDPAPDRLHPPVSFGEWWTRPILSDQEGNAFSRADLVLALANKDGGAHIDAALDEKYRRLTRENSLGFTQGGEQPISNSVVQASVRHIAGELLETLVRGLDWADGVPTVPDPICSLPYGSGAGGRNDPCPCGSGRKSKQCAGRRQPLLVMQQPLREGPVPGATDAPPKPDEPPGLILDSLLLVRVPPSSRQRAIAVS